MLSSDDGGSVISDRKVTGHSCSTLPLKSPWCAFHTVQQHKHTFISLVSTQDITYFSVDDEVAQLRVCDKLHIILNVEKQRQKQKHALPETEKETETETRTEEEEQQEEEEQEQEQDKDKDLKQNVRALNAV